MAGIGVFPLWMALTVMGLATGDPRLPVWLEQLLVLSLGIGLVARMQIRRPFYLFSILAVARPPDQLSPQRRRILSGFRSKPYLLVPLLVILVMIALGEWLYDIAPLFHALSFLPENRFIGLIVAGVGFWGANLFIQIPAAAAWALSSDQHQLEQYEPVDPESIEEQFTVIGKRWSNLLSRWDPDLLPETPPEPAADQPPEEQDTEESNQGSLLAEEEESEEITTIETAPEDQAPAESEVPTADVTDTSDQTLELTSETPAAQTSDPTEPTPPRSQSTTDETALDSATTPDPDPVEQAWETDSASPSESAADRPT